MDSAGVGKYHVVVRGVDSGICRAASIYSGWFMKKGAWSGAERQMALDMHGEGCTTSQIAQFLGCKRQRIWGLFRQEGIKVNRDTRGAGEPLQTTPRAPSDIGSYPTAEPVVAEAKVILFDRLKYRKGICFLDDKVASTVKLIRAANQVLKNQGKQQIGGEALWVK